jgi:Zn-dependent protease with chaperone function
VSPRWLTERNGDDVWGRLFLASTILSVLVPLVLWLADVVDGGTAMLLFVVLVLGPDLALRLVRWWQRKRAPSPR